MANDKSTGSALAVAQVTGITKGAVHETAISAAAAQAQAVVQARYVMAYQRPRDWDDTRIKLLKACTRPRFAETAIYQKPMGKKKNEQTGKWEQQFIEGPSIRFAEEAARSMGNVDIQTPVLYDDGEKRIVGVRVTDLESNTSYSADITIQKTVERRTIKDGQHAVGQRLNSYGDTVYILEATDDETLTKQNALISKSIRTAILRILPSDIREEAVERIYETVAKGDAADPDAARKKLADGFSQMGVQPSELKKYLGHELSACSPPQMSELRKIYAAIKEGEASWTEILKAKLNDGAAPEAKESEPKSRSQSAKEQVREKAAAAKHAPEHKHDADGVVEPAKEAAREPGDDDGPVPGRAY